MSNLVVSLPPLEASISYNVEHWLKVRTYSKWVQILRDWVKFHSKYLWEFFINKQLSVYYKILTVTREPVILYRYFQTVSI